MLTKPDSCILRASFAFLLMMALPRPVGLRFRFGGACVEMSSRAKDRFQETYHGRSDQEEFCVPIWNDVAACNELSPFMNGNDDDDDDKGRRAPLASRLDSLLSNEPTMHRTRKLRKPNHARFPSSSAIPPLRLTKPQSLPQDAVPSLPVLRWLGNWGTHARSRSSSGSNSPSSPPPLTPSPNSAALSSLNEALHESLLPSLPQPARLPDSFYTSRALSRPPPFLDNLTRSTLPVSSLSSNSALATSQSEFPESPPPIILSHSPPTRTSLDTLRSLSMRSRDRGIHTSAAAPATATIGAAARPASPKTLNWWWQSENKENVDTLLNEDDRADTLQEERDNLRNKCMYYSSH